MTTEEFKWILQETINSVRGILGNKAKEYATEDRLHNFYQAAALAGTTPHMALRGMMAKHIISVWDYIDRTEAGASITASQWDEKIIDSINYLILLRAIVLQEIVATANENSK